MSALIRQALARRSAEGRPILAGVIGAGDFGLSLVCQLTLATGMRAAAVADLDVEKGRAAFLAAGSSHDDVLIAGSAAAAADAVRAGRPVVVPDGALLAGLPLEA